MKPTRRLLADAAALAPLLGSIGRELEERSARLAEIEARLDELRASPRHSGESGELEAEATGHRRELRHCRAELEALGCSVVGTTPLTIRIPPRDGGAQRSQFWQNDRRARS